MTRFKRWALGLALALGLTACAAGPDLPMQADIDGHTVVLGRTTMEELADWGYEAERIGRQEVAHEGDKYIYFQYSLSRGADSLFQVSVYTPYYGGKNINKEADEAAQWGVVYSITLSNSSAGELSAAYNGVELQEITLDTARAWGARREEGNSSAVWGLIAAKGSLRFEGAGSQGGEGEEKLSCLHVTLSEKAFLDMHKQG